jgi:anti-sigma factor (TIGR02949 family)
MHNHNCNEILAKVSSVLDGALTNEEEQEFLNQLNECSCCLDKYNIEKSFKTFLQRKVERKTVSQECVDSLRQKLLAMKD